MATDDPELQRKLRELDHELKEGDITQKGYQKRRTLILSQHLGPDQEVLQRLRLHTSDDAPHPSNNGSRSASFAALNAGPQDSYFPTSRGSDISARSSTGMRNTSGGFSFDNGRVDSMASFEYPQGPIERFQERQLGVRNPSSRQSTFSMNDYETAHESSRSGTMMSANYAFSPPVQNYQDQQYGSYSSPDDGGMTRQLTMLDNQQGYFSDFTGQHEEQRRESYGGGPHRYSAGDTFSPTAAMQPPPMGIGDFHPPEHLSPLEPRDIPFSVFDPHDDNVQMSSFDNIAMVLRHRARTSPKQPAYWVLDLRGKEIASITWEKLASRAEKVAQVIRDKSNLYRGDRVALIYRDNEVIEFAIALMGCFIAGVVAVPINNLDDYHRLNLVLTSTQAHLALTTEYNLKTFQRDITSRKLNWPRGVEWWKTNEFGSFHPKKKEENPPLVVPDLAYIEFTLAPTGDLRGVVMSHRTIMHQMACMSAVISSTPTTESAKDTFSPGLRDNKGNFFTKSSKNEILLSYLDPRQGVGMILGVLLTVYGGHTSVWMESRAVETPGLYAHLITKYKATLLAADYTGLKRAAYNYQSDPMATRTFKKNFDINFSSLKLCLIDTITVDSEFHEILADRWLRPLRNPRAREIVAPMLCLPEHGGMVISVRDWLGGEERMGCPLRHEDAVELPKEEKKEDKSPEPNRFNSLIGSSSPAPATKKGDVDLGEVLLDKEALKTNEVVVLAMGEEARSKAESMPGAVRVGAFGYPIPDATLAIVDPETGLLCSPYVIGEVWVDSPSLSGGFWALPRHTETIFHARPYKFQEGNPTPVLIEPEFLRTGLLGCVIEGKVYILGLYEDRIRQKVEWIEHGMEIAEHRYFFVQHLVMTVLKSVPKIFDCSAFDIWVNDEHLPVILLETAAASTAPTTSGGPPRQLDIALLDSLAERCMEVLYQEHHIRIYCVMITAPNTLPRMAKNGRREIGNMLCRKEFETGTLPSVHIKFGVERSVQNLPVGVDPVGGIWSPISTQARQDALMLQDKQYSGVDYREVVIDDRTSTPLNTFSSIVDLFQWRVGKQAEELSYCTIDGRGKEGKGVTWKKLDLKVAAVAMYLRNKAKIRPGDHIILMYTHSEDFVYAVHACFCLGAIAIPMAPIDQNRLNEDAPAFLHMVADYNVKAVLVNAEVDHLIKQKPVSQHIKQSATVLKINVPPTYNTGKPPKQSSGCRDLGLTVSPAWVQKGYPVLLWIYWTPDQRKIAVELGHQNILGICKVQKETCQMTSSRPVLGCVRSTNGLGFIHTCLMGIYAGAPTYLVSPVDFAQNPQSLFLTLSRYKIKDTYATYQMLDHAMVQLSGKGFTLHELKNMMICTETRPRVDIFQRVRVHFAATGLDRTAINTIYSHVLNPMIASRSYMCIEPIELWLDPQALRRGLVYPVDPDQESNALLLQDSGMVPVSTQIAIVNPETCRLCHVGEYGEIWVQSEACVNSFYMSKEPFDAERFNGRTVDGDPHVTYVRTGDLGFLHTVTRPIGPGGQQVEMQILFVLGSVGETFEVNGLHHFPMDIETSIEKCHRNIVQNGCAVFQAGGLVVILVEVIRRSYLSSLVPVIVSAVLGEHQVVADIVAFVSRGDFPRSRLGEKQRGKILASWVTKKLRTIAQYSIRDPTDPVNGIQETGEGIPVRNRSTNTKSGSILGNPSSLRYAESAHPSPPQTATTQASGDYTALPTGISELPAQYDNSIQESPPSGSNGFSELAGEFSAETPKASSSETDPMVNLPKIYTDTTALETPRAVEPPEPIYDNKPILSTIGGHGRDRSISSSNGPGDLATLPSRLGGSGGLRVANAGGEEQEEWARDALLHMGYAQGVSRQKSSASARYDGRDYGDDGY
ncbi:MAG: hypothetical protein M1834_000128 [Cirrosporium novae-zelandiae]|nr:MAG: hypothetical protein M1834_000128 [Cirrosporium novae-zelandiae]